MKTLAFSCIVLTTSVAAALLSACGGSQPPIGAPGATQQTSALSERANTASYGILHSFGGPPDGSSPQASLIDVSGTLYGTTSAGGAYTCGSSSNGCGTVFTITTSGTEKVLYRFGAPPDGNTPRASLLDVDGTLYGTTAGGGSQTCGIRSYQGCGTVFSITTGGAENVLYSFGSHGVHPEASVIEVKGTLYGTTAEGRSGGTVFSIRPGGTEKVLHWFRHGASPRAGLIEVGRLYGTTPYGGGLGEGTVFSVTRGGMVKMLHSFGKGTDGLAPFAGLIEVNGTLYGTTRYGGTYSDGTIFSISPTGTEQVLYSFSGADGEAPTAALVSVNGTLYGTTFSGGAYNRRHGGDGTVFSITTSGTEQVLHSFGNGSDGRHPSAGLIDVGGTLYGTTSAGGAHENGTVFALTP